MHAQTKRLYEAAKELRGIQGPSELARALNISPQTLNNWERRGMSKPGLIVAQRSLGCSAVWLESGEGKGLQHSKAFLVPVAPPPVPVINDAQAAQWADALGACPVEDIEDWAPCPAKHSSRAYALRVDGDSMTPPQGPGYPRGSLIFVDPDRTAEAGDRVIAKRDSESEVTFKVLARDGGRVFLRPLNPQYPLITDLSLIHI